MFSDEHFMQRAIHLAKLAGIEAAPNPMVGAVIVHKGKIIGEGFHQRCGEAHAEVNAVNQVENKNLLSESTIYVTLEPCAHYGKTPPCAELLIKYNFKKVVIATLDPFSLVAGKGLQLLQAANIETLVGILENEAQVVNKRFFTFHNQKRPYIILKWAQSQDGFIDKERSKNETSEIRWITSPETQVLTHKWRTEEQAILVGWKTILNDNPSLTSRSFSGKNPLRILIDKEGKAPKNATVFNDGFPTLVFSSNSLSFENEAVENCILSDFSLINILNELYTKNILSVIIEGGSFTIQQFINENLWDEARVLEGNVFFEKGTKAPELNSQKKKTFQLVNDSLSIYKNN